MNEDPTTNKPQQPLSADDGETRDLLMTPFLTPDCFPYPRWRVLAQTRNITGKWVFTANERNHLTGCAACQKVRSRYERASECQPICTSAEHRTERGDPYSSQHNINTSIATSESIPAETLSQVTSHWAEPATPHPSKKHKSEELKLRNRRLFLRAGLLGTVAAMIPLTIYLFQRKGNQSNRNSNQEQETASIPTAGEIFANPVSKFAPSSEPDSSSLILTVPKCPEEGYLGIFEFNSNGSCLRTASDSECPKVPAGQPIELIHFNFTRDPDSRILVVWTVRPCGNVLATGLNDSSIHNFAIGEEKLLVQEVAKVLSRSRNRAIQCRIQVLDLNPTPKGK